MFRFNKGNKSKKGKRHTLFDIVEMSEFEDFDKLYFWGEEENDQFKQLIFWGGHKKYYPNPILPKSITEPLRKFNLSNGIAVEYKQIKETNCIIIGRKGMVNDKTPCLSIKKSQIETCSGFRQSCKNLKIAIEKWLEKYGITDLNITTSHHKD